MGGPFPTCRSAARCRGAFSISFETIILAIRCCRFFAAHIVQRAERNLSIQRLCTRLLVRPTPVSIGNQFPLAPSMGPWRLLSFLPPCHPQCEFALLPMLSPCPLQSLCTVCVFFFFFSRWRAVPSRPPPPRPVYR